MSPSESTKIEDMFRSRNKDTYDYSLSRYTKYSLIEGDLDNHQTEIDFGSVMKNLTFDLSLTRV